MAWHAFQLVVFGSTPRPWGTPNTVEVKLMAGLPELLRAAQYQSAEPDRQGSEHINAAHKYTVLGVIGGETLRVGLVAHEKKGGHEYYDHFVIRGGKNKAPVR
jgi:hypothetical protein